MIMLSRTVLALLCLALAPAAAAAGDATIRFSVEDGRQRAEFRLNGTLDCVLENGRITCAVPSR